MYKILFRFTLVYSNLTNNESSLLTTNENLIGVTKLYGSKNVNSYPYYHESNENNGITWTANEDGTVTASGVATANSYFVCHNRTQNSTNSLVLPNGTYIASGCPSGGSTSTYAIRIERTYNSTPTRIATDLGSEVTFELAGDDYSNDEVVLQIILYVYSGADLSTPITFEPMIRLASFGDSTYEPYSMSNHQLTETVAPIACTKTTAGTYTLSATVDSDGKITYSWA